ncbi:hypothetical protein AC630_04260 [Bradyrhizobium sp. AS23.2]|nr:hypothetical protein AC630_04260 [Bradyrhizobium sp. AS23.2]
MNTLSCPNASIAPAQFEQKWDSIVSDTTDNPVSANNFIQAGYRLYEPEVPWAWSHSLYWRRSLR